MSIFNDSGMMVFPVPEHLDHKIESKIVVFQKCFCPNGHNLVNKESNFNGYDGIKLRIKMGEKSGHVFLSPIFGDKTRVAMGISLESNEIAELLCPTCNILLPTYSVCDCGADYIALFGNEKISFSDCVAVCARVDCRNAELKMGDAVMTEAMLTAL